MVQDAVLGRMDSGMLIVKQLVLVLQKSRRCDLRLTECRCGGQDDLKAIGI